ncbi:lysophospholipid acyltransferase 5 [Nilaparvata lugens]|uniref:lysophospholipid acyltransferase 5 n=1 Tax=Nilaparvata lugens TaxID=108931 RepID=UPI00193D34E4|nr:lysophospholipid acyltransferase 5 [Nilaparvata lugens]
MEDSISMSSPGLIAKLASSVGASEAALRLLISIFLGFPIVLTHRYTLFGKLPNIQHLYFALTGLAINYFNYGSDILHTVVTVVIVYIVLLVFQNSYRGPIIVLSFTMAYLLIGYYMTATDTYDIKWTMPQCVLTLRLSGLAFDLYDGTLPTILYFVREIVEELKMLMILFDLQELSFITRCAVLAIWGHLALYKYISVWLLVEAVCIASGITYNGKDDKGNTKWNGLSNINLILFEGTTLFGHYIEAFNINTNHWVAQYIYKRLKFLGNRQLSQLGVLVFLAVWHGLHSGYYMCFFLEFICMIMEKDLQPILQRNGVVLEFLRKPGMKQLTWLALKVYTLVFMGYCMAPFVLLSYHKWWQVHKSFYFMGHILWMPWYLYRPIVKKLLPPKEHTS